MPSNDRRSRHGGHGGNNKGRTDRSSSTKRKPSGSPMESVPPKTQKQLTQTTLSPSVFTFGSFSPSKDNTSSPISSSAASVETHTKSPGNLTEKSSDPLELMNFINEAAMDVLTSKLKNVLMLPALQEKFRESFSNVAKTIMEDLVRDMITPLQKEITQLKQELHVKTDELEQYSRRNSVRICGVQESNQENTHAVVMDILKEVHPEVSPADIDRCHRIGKRSPQNKRQIIVKFVSYYDKNVVLKNRRKLRHKRDSVYVNEDLTNHRSKLFKLARDMRSKGQINATWTYDGRVYIEEQPEGLIRTIMCESDLDKYR